uniref:N(6)-L-threonylcarbamoyladenine synthase n=2 Tax=Aegilops tauschii subsp. strangulata TaxID=200361 RepID=A0A453EF13_AEGTS
SLTDFSLTCSAKGTIRNGKPATRTDISSLFGDFLLSQAAGSPTRTEPGKMVSTLLPTLSLPVSRATAFLLGTPLKSFRSHHPLLRSFLASASSLSSPPTPRSLVTMASAAIPARRDLLMLGIETSCDDTAAAVVRGDGEILSQAIASQSDLLVKWGGVAPKMAEEAHALAIDQVVQKALDDANVSESDLSAVAVTIGPGLSLCLRVGVHKARKIAKVFHLPIVGVHHMEAHALVSRLVNKDLDYPFLALLISGGHNLLVLAQNLGEYVQLGTTIDDAIGEAYDKSARWLGLDIRKGGGPALEELALEGDPNSINFRVPMRQHKDCNFSYAGLKTQVRLAIESRNLCTDDIPISSATEEDRQLRANIAASFQVQYHGYCTHCP